LTISKHLVEMHNGRLTASSPGPGQGSTFTIALPLP
ncbi:MAG: sensor histidine kinase, partial [Chloroflexi bacterium]